MAKELVRKSEASKAVATKSAAKTGRTGLAVKRVGSRDSEAPERHAAKKHAAKKSAAKKSVSRPGVELNDRYGESDLRLDLQKSDGERHGKTQDHKRGGKKAKKHKDEVGKAARHAQKSLEKSLGKAFHHLQRASAVISLIEPESGGDLKLLLHAGIELYREVTAAKKHEQYEEREQHVACALGLLAAAEHLAMAGLYAARGVHQLEIQPPPARPIEDRMEELTERLDEAGNQRRKGYPARLVEMARELLVRAEGADHDLHLAYELTLAVEGLTRALEAGLE